MAGKRVSKAEKEQRVQKIFELLVNGLPRYAILQYVADKTTWNLKARQVDNYIADAAAMLAIESEYQRPKELGVAIRRLNDLYSASMKVQDYARAISAQRELNKLLSLYASPAPQTLLVAGIDPAQLQVLSDALAARGTTPSALFEAMIAQLHEEADYEQR